jgi:hypothetical protein
MQVWVDYDSKTTVPNVTIAPYPLADKPSRPLISVTYDLSTILPTAQVLTADDISARLELQAQRRSSST